MTEFNTLLEIVLKNFKNLREDNENGKKSSTGKTIHKESIRDLAKDFSKLIGEYYDHTKISRLENNTRIPTLKDLFLYKEKYGVTYHYLLGTTNNKRYETSGFYEKYGLSDNALDTLKKFQNNSERDKINKAINIIFASDNALDFLLSLYEYLFENFEDKVPDTYYSTNGELAEIEFKSRAGDIELGRYYTNVKNLKSMNLLIVMDKIANMRTIVKRNTKKRISNPQFMKSLIDDMD